jgi:hypothetical protein
VGGSLVHCADGEEDSVYGGLEFLTEGGLREGFWGREFKVGDCEGVDFGGESVCGGDGGKVVVVVSWEGVEGDGFGVVVVKVTV